MRLKYSKNEILVYSSIILLVSLFLFFMAQDSVRADELVHMVQIRNYLQGDFSHLPELTTFTTYHHVVASLAHVFAIDNVYSYRLINLLFSILLLFFIITTIKRLGHKQQLVRFLQLIFLPIIFPLYYLVYTDILSLLAIVIALNYFITKRYFAALLFSSVAVLTRQTNLIWLVFFPAILFFEGYAFSFKNLPNRLLNVSSWIVVGIVFIIIFMFNDGVALGDKTQHHISINLGNFFFLVNVFCFIFFPILISRINEVLNILLQNKWLFIAIILLYPVYYYGFTVTHPYNHVMTDYFIRNYLLILMVESTLVNIISYVIFTYTILALTTIKLIDKKWNWLFIFAPLSVIPMPLIEQRYYIIALALWQLLRTSVNSKAEWFNFIWCFIFSIIFYIGIMSGKFFL